MCNRPFFLEYILLSVVLHKVKIIWCARGTEQMAEWRNEGTEQLQIVEEPVMNRTRVQSGTEMINNLSVGLKCGTDISSEVYAER